MTIDLLVYVCAHQLQRRPRPRLPPHLPLVVVEGSRRSSSGPTPGGEDANDIEDQRTTPRLPPSLVVIPHGTGCSYITLLSVMIMQAFLWMSMCRRWQSCNVRGAVASSAWKPAANVVYAQHCGKL
jgi:hypothetical protein